MEPILTPSIDRFILFPIKHERIWKLYKDTLAQVWVPTDIDMSPDVQDWKNKLKPEERKVMSIILAFFATSDAIVMENIGTNFGEEVQIAESRAYYAYQTFIESIHNETYSLMIDTLITKDPAERTRLFRAVETIPCVQRLAQWAMKWMNRDKYPFRVRIVAFVIYEGLLFQDKFATIFWFKKRNLLPGVCHANLLIARDEASHEDHGVELHDMLETRCEEATIVEMVKEAVELDMEFMSEAFDVDLIGINKKLMGDYIKFVANRILRRLHCKPIYTVERNVIMDLMDSLGITVKHNFFEGRNPNYLKRVEAENPEDVFRLNEDF